MATAVLLLWVFTAAAGARVLFSSNLGGRRTAGAEEQPAPATKQSVSVAKQPAPAAVSAGPPPSAPGSEAAPVSKREARRMERQRWDPPTLVRSRSEPMPGLRDLVEFAHPALGVIGLAFWLGYALVHNRTLAWIAFGLAAVTACVGLTWFTANLRAARRRPDAADAPSFSARLVATHGGAAAVTFALAALTALTAHAR
jgi:hypothetical protein